MFDENGKGNGTDGEEGGLYVFEAWCCETIVRTLSFVSGFNLRLTAWRTRIAQQSTRHAAR